MKKHNLLVRCFISVLIVMKIVEPTAKTPKQIANIRESGKYLNELLLILREKAKA